MADFNFPLQGLTRNPLQPKGSNPFGLQPKPKHKVFISYHHANDQAYKDYFVKQFGHLFINKSVDVGDIKDDLSTDYIKKLIQNGYLDDASICIILVGKETYKRKHIDWEISGALDVRVGGCAGLLGICLPTHSDYQNKDKDGKSIYNSDVTPPRLADNIKSGYAKYYEWSDDANSIEGWIEKAFNDRIALRDKRDNTRIQFTYNRA